LEKTDLIFFRKWFEKFCKSFYRENSEEQKNILLKEKHSHSVSENAIVIANGEAFGANDLMIAEIIGLFHDIGRFPQYARYKTFLDRISVNHGQLGAETLLAEGTLACLPEKEREIIVSAVRYHNAFTVPGNSDVDTARFTKLARDSDKIDIWRVFCEYFEGPAEERANAATLGLPDTPAWSEEAVATIIKKELVNLAHVRTVNDFKLLQLSWVFDLNFRSSFRLAQEQGSISRMARALPVADEITKAISIVQTYVSERAV
jgi:hypothetical protein